MTPPTNCPECAGKGWLLLFNTDTRALEVQRCDACERFASDEDARKWLATKELVLLAVIFELCAVAVSEIKAALGTKPIELTDLVCALGRVCDSLQQAVDLTLGESDRDPAETTAAEVHDDGTTYLVGVREVHVRYYEVHAGTPDEAKALAKDRAPEAVDIEFSEYSHELDPETWSVETKP